MTLRPITKADDPVIAKVIRTVLAEFGADRPGFAWQDPELDQLSTVYHNDQAQYLVIDSGGVVLGGAGFAPLKGGDGKTCELQKMYLAVEARGVGFGHNLITDLMLRAKKAGYEYCYLETLEHMTAANKLYLDNGFEQLKEPLGDTGHGGCNRWYGRAL